MVSAFHPQRLLSLRTNSSSSQTRKAPPPFSEDDDRDDDFFLDAITAAGKVPEVFFFFFFFFFFASSDDAFPRRAVAEELRTSRRRQIAPVLEGTASAVMRPLLERRETRAWSNKVKESEELVTFYNILDAKMIQFSQKSFEKGRQKMSRLLLLYTKRINTTNERRCCCLLELSTVFCSHLLLLLFAPFSFPGFDAHQLRAVRHRFGPSKGRVSFPPPVGVFPNVPVVAPVAGVTVFTYSSVWPVFFSPVFGEFMAVAVIPGGAFAFALATVGGVGTPSFGPTFTPGTTAAAVFADVSICRVVRFHAPFAIPFSFQLWFHRDAWPSLGFCFYRCTIS